jgi:hypothetical protein
MGLLVSNPVDQIQLRTFFTLTVERPILPPAVAVIVAEPSATAFTSPVEETLATEVLLDFQVTKIPVSLLPAASLRMAVN